MSNIFRQNQAQVMGPATGALASPTPTPYLRDLAADPYMAHAMNVQSQLQQLMAARAPQRAQAARPQPLQAAPQPPQGIASQPNAATLRNFLARGM